MSVAALALPVDAQEPGVVVSHITADDGLPVDVVTWLAQDPTGFLWVATFDGLVRYDGIRFEVFDIGTYPAMYSNRVQFGLVARDGSLWLIAIRPVHLAHGRFTAFGPARGLPGTHADYLYEDPAGTVWIGTDGGLARADGDRLVPVATGMSDGTYRVFRERGGAFWAASHSGIVRRFEGGVWTTFAAADGLAPGIPYAFAEEPAGTVWLLTAGGMSRYREGRLERLPVVGDPWPEGARTLTPVVLGGARWFALETGDVATDGFVRLDGGRLRVERASALDAAVARAPAATTAGWLRMGQRLYLNGRHVPTPPGYVNGSAVDGAGTLWLGMNRDGLYSLRPSLAESIGEPEGLASDNVYPLYRDAQGDVWAGTITAGLTRLRLDADGRVAATTTFTVTDGLVSNDVRTVLRDRTGALWVGMNPGLVRFASGTPSAAGAEVVVEGAVEAALEDRRGRLWFGASNGLWRVDGRERRHLTAADGLPEAGVRALLETRDGALWLGTNGGGVARLKGGRVERFTEADGLSSDLVRALYEDDRGALWIGTEGRGLTRLDLNDGALAGARVTVYREHDGLFDDVVHQILDDGHGRLWMNTNRGVFWVLRSELDAFAEGRARRLHATGYTEADGLRDREGNGGVQPAGFRAPDGRLWFPSQRGITILDPARVRPRRIPVRVEAVRADTARVAVREGAARLPRDERTLEIAFAAAAPSDARRLHVEYRLAGADDGWVPAGDQRVARYERLAPGRYTFEVRAYLDGRWSGLDPPLRVVVPPRFYETVWFALFAALGLAGLGYAGYVARTRQLRTRAERLETEVAERTEALRHEKETTEAQAERLRELDRQKSRFFTNVSHEFRTPLTLTIGPLEDLEAAGDGLPPEARRAVDLALRNSRRLLRLTNQLLDAARLEAGELQLRARSLDLAAHVCQLALPFAGLAERRRVRLDVVADAPVAVWADPELLEAIVVNLLSNAFKFTPEDGAIRVEVDEVSDGAEVRVRDSGPGIPASDLPRVFDRFYRVDETAGEHVGSGIGLALAKDLVDLHGGVVSVESVPGFGATFTVRLPLGRTHLRDDQLATAEPVGDGRPGPAFLPDVEPEAEGLAETGEDTAADDRTTVLVADDNADIRAYVRGHLGDRYRVIEAADGEAALALARAELPDLVLSDVMMPRLDGVALVRALKADPETDFVPVVLLTAKVDEADVQVGLDAGADDYVVKPFNVRTLLARIDNLIASRQRLKTRFAAEASAPRPLPTDGGDADAAFVARARAAVEARLSEEDFSVEDLADALGVSRSTLHRRLRQAGGETPTTFLRHVRLDRAAALLAEGAGTVSEVAYAVGFRSVSHFSQAFRRRFGISPSAAVGASVEGEEGPVG